MPCSPLPNGAFICSRGGSRPRCVSCGKAATRMCDFPLTGKKAGKTCDRPLCASCAVTVGRHERKGNLLPLETMITPPTGATIDYCPAHAAHVKENATR